MALAQIADVVSDVTARHSEADLGRVSRSGVIARHQSTEAKTTHLRLLPSL